MQFIEKSQQFTVVWLVNRQCVVTAENFMMEEQMFMTNKIDDLIQSFDEFFKKIRHGHVILNEIASFFFFKAQRISRWFEGLKMMKSSRKLLLLILIDWRQKSLTMTLEFCQNIQEMF